MNNLDWHLIRSFLAVAKHGSLSAAARILGVSQPTLSRDIHNLEQSSGLNLFKRTTQGLHLTETGESLVHAATCMDEAADQFSRQASGLSEHLQGDVRISVNEIVGIYLLPPAIAVFRQQHPAVQIEITICNHTSSLSKREADIALRMFRPTQVDLVARRLPDLALGFYAHQDYINKFGEPANLDEFAQHTIIGFDENTEFIDSAAALGYTLNRNNFNLRTDHVLAQVHLGRAGAGIVCTHVQLAKTWPDMVQVLKWIPVPALEFWLVCHRDVQYNSRIRALMRFLGRWFADDPYRGFNS